MVFVVSVALALDPAFLLGFRPPEAGQADKFCVFFIQSAPGPVPFDSGQIPAATRRATSRQDMKRRNGHA
ncbi:hypothetical protein [Maritimibacter alkaliphilus]|uniref:Uncharacterized protein n=1 Tax=Maritimibacter alkaliphilus HTCC2654 TaxID=314271 RepID=A3VMX4_9RHOB|nr:hypothetical protein [Maritimibacter alkaliphilus]EAQ10394.1 hypothetical protein RB2654_21008 [Rhodobacterales bacterium HTCC2654] [Maritimibacter alkaliphilus HTCC2654]